MSNGWKKAKISRRQNACSCFASWYVIEWKNKDGGNEMKVLRKSSENEMILEFLKAEYTSVRFSEELKNVLWDFGCDRSIIFSADLQDMVENRTRKRILGAYRGYGEDRELFECFPEVYEWNLCSFSGNDIEKIRYIDYSYWNELSVGTKRPLDAVKTIRNGIRIYDVANDGFLQAAEYIKKGGTFPKLFFLTADEEQFVIVEGHLRMTAYALAPECFKEVEVIVGKCSSEQLERWM